VAANDDAEGEEGDDLDMLEEQVVQAHLELEGDVDMLSSLATTVRNKRSFLFLFCSSLLAQLVLLQPSIGYLGDCFDTCFLQLTCRFWLIMLAYHDPLD
jgi:hypothetical protein